MYINLKNFDNVDELNKFLDDLSENDIRKYKNAIFSQRKEVLKNVSTRVFVEKLIMHINYLKFKMLCKIKYNYLGLLF